MIHINFNSGGIGSYSAGKRIIAEHGADNVINLFTDTLIEDRDLYRFLIETNAEFYGIERPVALLEKCADIPDITSEEAVTRRKELLAEISTEAMRLMPNLIWIAEGRTPWEVFFAVRYLGNSRIAQCSHVLKQATADKWIRDNYGPDECVLYLGIDWTEAHRREAPIKNWAPYRIEFPMCDEPLLYKYDMLELLDAAQISRPRLYGKGFAHNNCGGFCVRAGQGHFLNLLTEFPEQYAYHENKEEDIRTFLGKNVSILKRVRGKKTYRLTLRQLRGLYEDTARRTQIDREDIGGCGCFVSPEAADE
ncbi:hypothetical protein [Paenibacillus planticolens]|uniref:Phosphoadenosine phosphosulphate reductase domain-containing protein n=1 Tax=Paenibacillus planticolens TaxID=2654976 RepID=A0ABX1ZED4_9BACL|nr:hypothetical protein [Paenibacillus planticolens]NOU98463.1 hypothetical protein [Paenibacillus planticolens]